MKMIYSNPMKEASFIEDQTGVPTIAAFDGMSLKIGDKIQVAMRRKKFNRTLG
jgi:hypothetical protein